ncbi:MAG: divalent-cation tolerance protein CutA [Planctomycetota bacterium]
MARESGETLDARVVLVTATSADEARRIAEHVVEERLAACVNVLEGLTSIYRWEGRVVSESECLLVIKTRAALFDRLEARIRQLHSYTTPEIVALPIVQGFAPYLRWIEESTG